jgi:LPS O-antigen subunit length determinant protein (WzzB/FepE family)
VSTKSHGWRMSTIKMTRRTIRKERNRKKSHSWNLSIQMETDLIQTWSNLWKGKLWISTQTLLLMILQN